MPRIIRWLHKMVLNSSDPTTFFFFLFSLFLSVGMMILSFFVAYLWILIGCIFLDFDFFFPGFVMRIYDVGI